MTTTMTGVAGEQIAVAEFARRGVEVYTAAGPYASDLMIRLDGKTYAVQVKSMEVSTPARFWFRRSRNKAYSGEDVDLYAAVEVSTGRVALLPYMEASTARINFNHLRPEWDFDNVLERLREGGL